MKNLLITNIGNRNILYKNQLIDNKVFRIETEKIWQNLEVEKENITVQIIPNHIDSDTGKIILVSTSQENPIYNYQDTFYEGKILKILIEQKYNIPVEVEVFNGNPTNENEIFPFYSALLRRITKEYNFSKLFFNDAGGTPQMKLVIKELMDFYIGNNRYQIVYSDQNDEKREIERIYKNKYELLKIAQKFVDEFNYSAAYRVLEEIPAKASVSDNLISLVWLASKRINFELNDIEKKLRQKTTLTKLQSKAFETVMQKNAPEKAIDIEPFNNHSRLNIFEIASICQLYFSMGNYTLAIATYYRFCEEFFQRFARNSGHYDLTRLSDREKFLTDNYDELVVALHEITPERNFFRSYGLPTLSLYALVNGNDRIKQVALLFIKTISLFRQNPYEGIDLLRNQCFLAHKNNAVTEMMINKTEPEFLKNILPEIFKSLNMPEENIYFSLNRLITNEIMNN